MAIHNQLKKISITPQANTIPYSDENGYISNWLTNDPVISSLKGQNEFIGSVPTLLIGTVSEIPTGEDLQDYLSQYVQTVESRLPQLCDEVHVQSENKIYVYNLSNLWVETNSTNWQPILTHYVKNVFTNPSRDPRSGDEVVLQAESELWLYNGTEWMFFTTTSLKDATTTSKGVVQIGSGLSVLSGVVSLDSTAVTTSRTVVNSTSTTPSIALAANTDYVFSNNLSSLTITSVPTSQYDINLYFSTGASFTFSCSSVTSWYLSDNPPTFDTNSTYKITFSQGKGQVLKVGEVSANVSPTLTYFDTNTGTKLNTSIVFASYNLVKVYKNGVLLRPNSGANTYDYSLSTTEVTFTEALVSTDTICIETI